MGLFDLVNRPLGPLLSGNYLTQCVCKTFLWKTLTTKFSCCDIVFI
jgi:hypothetical protein